MCLSIFEQIKIGIHLYTHDATLPAIQKNLVLSFGLPL